MLRPAVLLAAVTVAVAGPVAASVARMARLLGSARATKTCSAIASMSGGIEVADQLAQLAQLADPAFGVGTESLAVCVIRQLGETALDHRQLPNQVPRPWAVVSAAHTRPGG